MLDWGKRAQSIPGNLYADVSDKPVPDPVTIANQFINDKTRAILIIDNCPPDLHHRLTQICSRQQSTVSLLTVEYDVRDDLPEETRVFRLKPASDNIIEKLISKRFAYISQVDTRTIASFSGGNARVAIALATPCSSAKPFQDSITRSFSRGFSGNTTPTKIACSYQRKHAPSFIHSRVRTQVLIIQKLNSLHTLLINPLLIYIVILLNSNDETSFKREASGGLFSRTPLPTGLPDMHLSLFQKILCIWIYREI